MKALVCVALLALAGCATTTEVVGIDPPGAGVQPLPDTWTANGRIAVALAEEGGSAQFRWRQAAELSRVRVVGPMGIGALEIEHDGAQLSVTDASGKRLDAEAARAMLARRLGVGLPLTELRYWMQGLAEPTSPSEVHDSPKPPRRRISQAGWVIEYERFESVEGHSVPVRFTADSGTLRLRMVVDEWIAGVGPGIDLPVP